MNDTWCLRIDLRRQLGYVRLERRLRSPYVVLLLILLFALGTQFVTQSVEETRRDQLLTQSPFLRLLDFVGGGAYRNASIFGVSVLFLVTSRTFMTLAITFLPSYRVMLDGIDAGRMSAARQLERHFIVFDVATALAFTILLTRHEVRHGVIAGDLRAWGTAITFYFAGAVLLLLIVIAIEASNQADGLQAILATGFVLSAVRWLIQVDQHASRSVLLLAVGMLVAALVIARLLELYASVKIPLRSPATAKNYSRGLLDVGIAPEAPFGLDRILTTAAVLLAAYTFDRLRVTSPLLVSLAVSFGVACALHGVMAVARRFAHLREVSRQMKHQGSFIENRRPGTDTMDYLCRRAWSPLSWEVAFVASGLVIATLFPVPAHPLTFVAMWAVVELCASMYMHWKWVWRRDETLDHLYGKFKSRHSTR
jgi:preprotein translocase subunit SecY